MADLHNNLKALMAAAKVSASELSRKTGVAQPIIHRLCTGQNINPKLATIRPLCDYFMVTMSQLIGEEKLPTEEVLYKSSHSSRRWRHVPIISWAQSLAISLKNKTLEKNDSVLYSITDAIISEGGFVLQITDTHYEPIFHYGTLLYVDPERTPRDRDLVIVQQKEQGTITCKRVLINGMDCYLKSLNQDLVEINACRLNSNDHIIGVVVQSKLDYISSTPSH